MQVDLGTQLDDIKGLIGGVYWILTVVIVVYLFLQMNSFYRVLFLAFLVAALGVSQAPKTSLFTQACSNHSTLTACSNFGECDNVDKAFAIDPEWAVLRRNSCIEGMPTSKARLLHSYNPDRCEAWGDCAQACKDKLTDIRSQIENVSCEKDVKDMGPEEVADEFPLTQTSFLPLFPFNGEGIFNVMATIGILLCVALMIGRLARPGIV